MHTSVHGRRRSWHIPVAAMALLAGGCGNAVGNPGPMGRVQGTALAGLTCPVERPGDPACAPRPVAGTIEFRQGNRVVATATIDSVGRFTAELPIGNFTVTVDVGTNVFPVCTPVEVVVAEGSAATVEVQCDTGIR